MSRQQQEIVKQLEQTWPLRGRRVRDVPELADWRFRIRERYYRVANTFFGLCVFELIVAAYTAGLIHWLNVANFAVSFPMMFYCEFQARTLTRQLHRPAAEQIARDYLGIRG